MAKAKGRGPGKWVTSPAYRAAIAKLVAARKAAEMSQRDLAKALGLAEGRHTWVAKVEQCERRLDFIEFIAMARALGLSELELLRIVASDLPKRPDI